MLPIVLDNIIFSWQRSGGISTVWGRVIQALAASGMDYRVLEWDGANRNVCRRDLKIPSAKVTKLKALLPLVARYQGVKWGKQAPFIFHSSYYRLCTNPNAINILTVHDFTYERCSSGLKRAVHHLTKRRAIQRADRVICVSSNTRDDLLHYVPGVNPEKVRVIYNGVDEKFRRLSDHKRFRSGIKPFLLYLGERTGYKNFRIAVETAQLMGIELKIAGPHLNGRELNWLTRMLDDRYQSLGYVDTCTLNRLLNEAFALIYPSAYEGFGLPIVEAQKAGCPVLALNSSSLPEVMGDETMLVDEPDPKAFTQKARQLYDHSVREHVIAQGVRNAERFSWNQMAQQYLDLYREVSQ